MLWSRFYYRLMGYNDAVSGAHGGAQVPMRVRVTDLVLYSSYILMLQ
jgi:hypothetical protein